MKRLSLTITLLMFSACAGSDVKPVDIYEEDACSFCRMAISDARFAGEIVTGDGEVFKFDDLGCLQRFRQERLQSDVRATFVREYESGVWLPEGEAVILRSGVMTPMNSGLVAFSDSAGALEFVHRYPPGE